MEAIKQTLKALQKGDSNSFTQIRADYDALLTSMVNKCLTVYHYDAEFDDLMQEASLALYHAALTYDLDQSEVTFGLYAKICIRNRLISAGRKLKRQKKNHRAAKLRSYTDRTQKRSVELAQLGNIDRVIEASFSDFEKSVFTLYLQGCSYKEMARALEKNEKSIDNAVCRMKSKLKKHYNSNDE